ncbi:MAG: hypothetical protein HN590_19235, partial [Calditrichaeota bacterium]|nr:hypothetical protein [Calditrichota bacterium]
ITLFGFVLSAFLAFNALQLSSCNSDDKEIATAIFLTLSDHSLPVVRITIDEKYLWSEDSGLFVVGNNGAEYAGQIANYYQDWEFPSYLSYWKKHRHKPLDHVISASLKGLKSAPGRFFSHFLTDTKAMNPPVCRPRSLENRYFVKNQMIPISCL